MWEEKHKKTRQLTDVPLSIKRLFFWKRDSDQDHVEYDHKGSAMEEGRFEALDLGLAGLPMPNLRQLQLLLASVISCFKHRENSSFEENTQNTTQNTQNGTSSCPSVNINNNSSLKLPELYGQKTAVSEHLQLSQMEPKNTLADMSSCF